MARKARRWPKALPLDRIAILLLMLGAVWLGGRGWLADHPQHDPWAPLDLRQERGWATGQKLAALRSDPEECRAVLTRSAVAFTALEPVGEGACRREDRLIADDLALSPSGVQMRCPVAAGLTMWWQKDVQPLAREILGQEVARIEQIGTYNCRRMYGASQGRWSEHATGNAIDIAGFVMADGTRITVLRDWPGEDDEARFLRELRDAACSSFATVLSPDYNAAHADHLHLDQTDRMGGYVVCR